MLTVKFAFQLLIAPETCKESQKTIKTKKKTNSLFTIYQCHLLNEFKHSTFLLQVWYNSQLSQLFSFLPSHPSVVGICHCFPQYLGQEGDGQSTGKS